MSAGSADLWKCPVCGRDFAVRNQSHSCGPLADLERHFEACAPTVRATFDALVAELAALGPFAVLPEKTRIAFHVRMSFAAVMPRRRWLNGHLILARPVESARFHKVEVYSPRNVLHAFRLASPAEIDEQFVQWLGEAYRVGEQRHPRRASSQW